MEMSKTPVFVTGHRNPDLDSVCAAWAYAQLKNRLEKSSRYTAVRPGNLNPQTRFVFQSAGIQAPRLKKDIRPRVADVTKRDLRFLDAGDPIIDAIRELDQKTLSVIPIFHGATEFRGMVSIHEITNFLVAETRGDRPVYHFLADNIARVVPGFFFRRGAAREFRAPVFAGAMTLENCRERVGAEGAKPVLVVGLREELIDYAVREKFPCIILTGWSGEGDFPYDFGDYPGTVYVSKTDTAETIRLVRLSAPVVSIADTDPLRVDSRMDFDKAKQLLVGSEVRGLPVFDSDRFAGVITRRCFIEKPRKKLIMVDHNEAAQSLPGADSAEVVEILDHHRIGADRTRNPIFLYAKPVGSTCTIVSQLYQDRGVEIDETTALILLSGILSDTLGLKSPTTTDEDRLEVQRLSETAGKEWESWSRELMNQSVDLRQTDPGEVLRADLKIYDQAEIQVGIGQVEVLSLETLDEVRSGYFEALEELCREKKLDWSMILVTDVLKQRSLLLTSGEARWENRLYFQLLEGRVYDLPDVISRKKQLLPEILRVIDEERLG